MLHVSLDRLWSEHSRMRTALLVAAALLALVAQQVSACGLAAVCNSSPFFGKKCGSPKTVNQTDLRLKYNVITKISAYYSTGNGCIKGIKPRYGWNSANSALIGSTSKTYPGLVESDFTVSVKDPIVKAEVAAAQCVHYVKLTTKGGKTFSVGKAPPTVKIVTSTPTCKDGYLFAFAGTEIHGATAKDPCSPLQQLAFVWGRDPCESPKPSPVPSPKPSEAPLVPEISPEPEVPSPEASPEPPSPEPPSPEPSPVVNPPNPSPLPVPSPPPVPSPLPSPPPPLPSPPVCVVPTIIPACTTSTGLCTAATCEVNKIESTIVDCTVGKATAACAPWSCVIPGACIPTTTQSCLGNLTCTGNGCATSPLVGSPCLVPACSPQPPATPSPSMIYKPTNKPAYTPTPKWGKRSKDSKGSTSYVPTPSASSTPAGGYYTAPVYVAPISYGYGRRLRGGKASYVPTPATSYAPTPAMMYGSMYGSYSSTPSAYSYTPAPAPSPSCGFYVCGCPPTGAGTVTTLPAPVPVAAVPLVPVQPVNSSAAATDTGAAGAADAVASMTATMVAAMP